MYDGEGLRTVVYLKGCPLRCRWCSTPESLSPLLEEGFNSERDEAIRYGRVMTVDQVTDEIAKDEIFYFHSGGGVTLSGGECLLQPDFCAEILERCSYLNIRGTVETCACVPWENIAKVLPLLKDIFIDIKLFDAGLHKEWSGVDNAQILANIRAIDESPYDVKIAVRIPLIPGVSDTDDNLARTAEFCKSLKKIAEIEVLPYHRLGLETYRRLGKEYPLADLKPHTTEEARERAEFLAALAAPVPVRLNGAII